MFIIRNIPEQKYFVDIKHVTVTADSPDLSDYVTELAYLMLKSFTPQTGITIEEGIILVYISNERIFGNIPEHIRHRSHNRDQIITFIKDTKSRASCECFTLILHIYVPIWLHHVPAVTAGEIENY